MLNMKLLKVNRSCFCCSLRWGIILFGYINLLFSIFAVACLLIRTDMLQSVAKKNPSLQLVTSTVLFATLGMGVILNVLLLAAGFKKDAALLRLYNFYALFTTMAALVPTLILLVEMQILVVAAAFCALVMQCYVILLVRSEISKLKQKTNRSNEESASSTVETIDVPDLDTLICGHV